MDIISGSALFKIHFSRRRPPVLPFARGPITLLWVDFGSPKMYEVLSRDANSTLSQCAQTDGGRFCWHSVSFLAVRTNASQHGRKRVRAPRLQAKGIHCFPLFKWRRFRRHFSEWRPPVRTSRISSFARTPISRRRNVFPTSGFGKKKLRCWLVGST